MDDDRVWQFEESLWIGGSDRYRELVDDLCLMVLPSPPHVFSGSDAIDAVSSTPRWTSVTFQDQQIARPQDGLIVVGYHVEASRDEERFSAFCTSTYRRRGHEDWQVVQHQQTIPLTR